MPTQSERLYTNQISTTESAVKLQEIAAIFSHPNLQMMVHTVQKYNDALKKYAKFARFFHFAIKKQKQNKNPPTQQIMGG